MVVDVPLKLIMKCLAFFLSVGRTSMPIGS